MGPRLRREIQWRCAIPHGSPEHAALDDAFKVLGSDQGVICPGSFRTITTTRPAHSGGEALLWGPDRRKELARILRAITTTKEE